MPQKMTKKRNISKAALRKQRQRQQRRMQLGAAALVVSLVACVALMSVLNTTQTGVDYAYTKADSMWYVNDGEVEIAAVQRENPQLSTAATAQPTSAATEQPTSANDGLTVLPNVAAATQEPVATAEPQALATATATPSPSPSAAASGFSSTTSITITAVGDCTLGGDTNSSGAVARFNKYYQQYGADYYFQNVRSLFENDDLTIINLEGPLTTSTDKRSGRTYNFKGDPAYTSILTGSSVEICNIANNHALDFGTSGLKETAQVLSDAGVGASGFGLEYTTNVKGYTVCSLGFTEWDYTEDQIVNAISTARAKCDLLLVSIHWGKERSYTPSKTVEALGRKMVDAGADLVIGNHSHVYGQIEQYKGKYIIYSLGNFCFGGNKNPSIKDCAIFQQTFEMSMGGAADGGINIIPASVSSHDSYNDFQPVVLEGTKGISLLKKIAKLANFNSGEVSWMDQSYVVLAGIISKPDADQSGTADVSADATQAADGVAA